MFSHLLAEIFLNVIVQQNSSGNDAINCFGYRKVYYICMGSVSFIQCPESAQSSLSGPATGPQRPRDDFVGLSDSSAGECDLSETALVRLHRRVIVSVQQFNSTHCQWNKLIENAVHWEDVGLNRSSGSHVFVRSSEVGRKSIWSCCRCPRFG